MATINKKLYYGRFENGKKTKNMSARPVWLCYHLPKTWASKGNKIGQP